MPGGLKSRLAQLAQVRADERRPLGWSFLYFFFLLTAYYILRPMREARGQGLGVQNLPWLYSATFVCMLALHPLWSALVSRFPRERLLPWVYRFFAANLLVFYLAFRGPPHWFPQAAYFVWTSVFGLMAVSVFWSFMSDVWRTDQAKRLFGMVALGGGLGAIVGPLLTSVLVGWLSPAQLLLVAAGLLEVVTFCLRRVSRTAAVMSAADPLPDPLPRTAEGIGGVPRTAEGGGADPREGGGAGDAPPVGGGVLSGLAPLLRSPYLAMAAGIMALAVISATFNNYLQARLVAAAGMTDQVQLTRFFARLDLAGNLLTAIAQGLIAAPLLARYGALPALVLVPAISLLGFGAASFVPTLMILAVMLVLRRASVYGLMVPAYGLLFTLVGREDRYKVRTFIDTVIYRGGDLVGGWAFTAVLALGGGVQGAAAIAAALAVPWLVLAVALGRMQRRRSAVPPGAAG